MIKMINMLMDYSTQPFSDTTEFFIYTLILLFLSILFVKFFGIENSFETIGIFFSIFLMYLSFTGVIDTIYFPIALIVSASIFYSISNQNFNIGGMLKREN